LLDADRLGDQFPDDRWNPAAATAASDEIYRSLASELAGFCFGGYHILAAWKRTGGRWRRISAQGLKDRVNTAECLQIGCKNVFRVTLS
jgi:hypothetical protein